MTSYSLQIHSYNVNLGSLDGEKAIGRHTGYSLVVIDNGVAVIHAIDLSRGDDGKVSISITSAPAEKVILTNMDDPTKTQEVYWAAGADAEQMSTLNMYMSPQLASDTEALEAFNKIKLDAVLTNIANQVDYDMLGTDWRVCNTATSYWGQQYISGFTNDVFDTLPQGLWGYGGKDGDYVNASGYKQAEKIKSIRNLVDILLRFGNVEDILTSEWPYLSEKYLSILEPYLTQETFSSSDEPSLVEIVRSISMEIISFPLMNFISTIPDVIKKITKTVTTAEAQTSPLVIDLDGDGIETTSMTGGTYFDHDGNGFSEKTAWAGKDDGLLVRDLNNNGQIDNGSELFGNNTVLSNGEKAANGFEALKDLDSNNDGVFNNQDTAWNEVKVWKDTNQNGIVDEGELLTLEQANISGINLTYDSVNFSDSNDNAHKQQGTFIKSDGTTGAVHDVWFDADYADTLDKSNVEISDEIKALPEVLGFGNVHSLQTAMALDAGLKTLVEQYIAETNYQNRDAVLTDLIYRWAGVQDEDPYGFYNSEGWFQPEVDCRKFCVLEEFLGEKYNNASWGREVHPQAAQYLLSAFDNLKEYIKNELDKQSHVSALLEKIKLTWMPEQQEWQINIDEAITELKNIYGQNAGLCQYTVNSLAKVIQQQGTLANEICDVFRNRAQTEVEHGIYYALANFGAVEAYITENDDIIKGTSNNNIINGLGGNDRIFGGAGEDVLIGGAGNDYLVGEEGSDTYFFEGSWGHDAIENTSTDAKGEHPDTILFGEGIVPADVTVIRNLNDLVLSLHDGADKITVYGYFVEAGTTTQTVDYIKFADGTVWTYDDVRTIWWNNPQSEGPLTTKEGTDANDYMKGTTGNDLLLGRDGNDTINGQGGSDIFVGGKGDDRLEGWDSNDTYVWNRGDGLDTISESGGNDIISFGKGISFSDLAFRYVDGNLQIIVNGDESQGIIVERFFNTRSNSYKIEDIRFFDGSVFHLSDVGLTLQQSNEGETVYATEFNDIIYGNGGDDTINGGKVFLCIVY